MLRIAAFTLLVLCPFLGVSRAAAQEVEDVDAREAFSRGSTAAAEERWADSERWFRRAYEASGVSSALFNQAVALRALGRHREARDAFAELLEGGVEGPVRETATELMQQSAARVATLQITGLDADAEHSVQLDGEPRPDDRSRPFELEADEGQHSILVVRAGHEPFNWSGSLGPGATVEVAVELEALARQTVVVTETVHDGNSVFEEPAFWIVVGLVVAGSIAAAGTVVAFDEAQLQPMAVARFEL